MAEYKTPGVYIVELDAFPNTIVAVATAIPVFIGYTAKAVNNKKSLTNKPTRITTLGEYTTSFGGAPKPIYTLTSKGSQITLAVASGQYLLYNSLRLYFVNGGGPCYIVSVGTYGDKIEKGNADLGTGLLGALTPLKKEQEPTMVVVPDAVTLKQQDCYDVYNEVLMHCQKMQSRVGILDVHGGDKERGIDPATDVVDVFRNKVQQALNYGASYYPWLNTSIVGDNELDYTNLDGDSLTTLNTMLTKEADVLFDPANPSQVAKKNQFMKTVDKLKSTPTVPEAVDTAVATAQAELGAQGVLDQATTNLTAQTTSYQGSLETWRATLAGIKLPDGKSPDPALPENDSTIKDATDLSALNAFFAINADTGVRSGSLFKASQQIIQLLANDVDSANDTLLAASDVTPALTKAVEDATEALASAKTQVFQGQQIVEASRALWMTRLAAQDNAKTALKALTKPDSTVDDFTKNAVKMSVGVVTTTTNTAIEPPDPPPAPVNVTTTHLSLMAVSPEYRTVMQELKKKMNVMPPAAAMAGVYARIDNSIGVFKAPANTGLVSVVSPTVDINHDEQEDLNVPLNGKAVNAIRSFPGYGVLIWGARTLDGNSQDWRYINVRRTLIMIEQSVKAAMQAYVFEPNVASTWSTVNSMITNFLTNQWKGGALAGSTPQDAFEVHIGLGSTMTPNDILDGFMRVTVKVALVRPAEFIILTFQQKVQTS